ncbi:ribonuclease H2 subunit A-like [Planoprotostelium fungivorum]|uniref:Ribonuclease n=1 Tax=Planoprotostelium fungivorum TaxID=1890364 RepID=A0A2P6NNB8_9EUKA|nr:ribonuclease H2 subunit A-like [Planoprotostelium fungivorum]
MIYGCAYVAVSNKEILAKMGFADSKVLNEAKRDALYDRIRRFQNDKEDSGKLIDIGYIIDVIEPEHLSGKMSRIGKINLNAISHDSAAGLIQKALDRGANITEVFVDAVGPPAKYQAKLKSQFPDIEIKVSNKADSLFPIVSAASICAKVIRDSRLKNWQFKERKTISSDFNSGYPSDPQTKKWMEETLDPIFGFPSLVRFSWKNCDLMLKKNAADVKWEEEMNLPPKNRAKYFSDMNLYRVSNF